MVLAGIVLLDQAGLRVASGESDVQNEWNPNIESDSG